MNLTRSVCTRSCEATRAIEPEIVNWRTGGVVKNAATLGLDKGHVNGTVAGPHSTFTVSSVPFGMAGPIEFYIRCLREIRRLSINYFDSGRRVAGGNFELSQVVSCMQAAVRQTMSLRSNSTRLPREPTELNYQA
jgi:hypothetical protein